MKTPSLPPRPPTGFLRNVPRGSVASEHRAQALESDNREPDVHGRARASFNPFLESGLIVNALTITPIAGISASKVLSHSKVAVFWRSPSYCSRRDFRLALRGAT